MGQPKRKPRLPKRHPRLLFPISEEELTKMAKWFVATVGAIDQWQDFVQEAFLILWKSRDRLREIEPENQKKYAAVIVWNHWKKTPEKITYHSDPIERPVTSDSELFYELAIEHLLEIASGRAKLVLRELIHPSLRLQRLLQATMNRKKYIGDRPVEPLLSAIAEVLGFKISDHIGEIKQKVRETLGTIGNGLL